MIEEEFNKKEENYEEMLNEIKKEQEIQKAELLRKTILMRFLTKQARERLNRIRVAHPELAFQFEASLFQAVQGNQLNEPLTDEQVKEILKELTKDKKSVNIIK